MSIKSTRKKIFALIGIFSCITLLSNILISSSTPIESNNLMELRTASEDPIEMVINKTWGGINSQYGEDIALDDSGNIYIAGKNSSDAFITKMDNAGNILQNIIWDNGAGDSGTGIDLDDSGNIYIVGSTDIGGSNDEAFVVKYNSSGDQQWNATWGGGSDEYCQDIAVNSSGDIYITGFSDSFGIAGSVFVTKFNNSGDFQWVNIWDGAANEQAFDIALDNSGYIYITGRTASMGAGSNDAFIAKFDSLGNSVLNITWGTNTNDGGRGIIVDNEGYIYITGYTYLLDTDGDALVAKYRPDGLIKWNEVWGGEDADYGYDIALDSDNNVYIIGETNSFGVMFRETFFAKLGATMGTIQWNYTYGGDNNDDGKNIAVDTSGNIFLTGGTGSFGLSSIDAFLLKYSPISDNPPSNGGPDNGDTPPTDTPGIPGYNMILLIGFLGVLVLILMRKHSKFNK